jgi:hypothetical protein
MCVLPVHASPDTGGIPPGGRTRIIIDSDANNELDDQHAIAYVLLNPGTFDVEGITVNKTFGGGSIREHAEEAERVVRLCARAPGVRVYEGATGDFRGIRDSLDRPSFDGSAAVNFIIERAEAPDGRRLVVLAIGKLTNVSLALARRPAIGEKIRIVWLGSNYPEPGEYNFENDTAAVNYCLALGVPMEIATVRYGASTGTAAVQASVDEIRARVKGKGPRVAPGVRGRHGGEFTCFGDYSVDLFEHVKEKTRSLYDMAAAAVVRNPSWSDAAVICAPRFQDGRWIEQPGNPRTIVIRENFDRAKIMRDFYLTMDRR